MDASDHTADVAQTRPREQRAGDTVAGHDWIDVVEAPSEGSGKASNAPSATSLAYQETVKRASGYFTTHGAGAGDAASQAGAFIGQSVASQAVLLSYIDVFALLGLGALLIAPLALLMRHVDLGGKAARG